MRERVVCGEIIDPGQLFNEQDELLEKAANKVARNCSRTAGDWR